MLALKYFLVSLTMIAMLIRSPIADENTIVGKWHMINNNWKEMIEFFADGSYRLAADWGVSAGKWRFVDENHISLGTQQGEAINDIFIDGDIMTLKDVKEHVYIYKKSQ